MKNYLFILLVILFGVLSCSESKKAAELTPETIEGEWEILFVNGLNKEAIEKLTINFNQGKVNGFAGCNKFFGSYTLNNNNISFSPLGTTRMLCESNLMKIENTLLKSLKNITNLTKKQNEMHFFNNEKQEIITLKPKKVD